MYKKCSRCLKEKDLAEFYTGRNSVWCKKCYGEAVMERRKQNPEKYKKYLKDNWTLPTMIFSHKKANAKKEHIMFTITKSQFVEWYKKQQPICTYCGIKPWDFVNSADKHLIKKVNLGLDRTDNKKGYELNNIVLCCNRCNYIKGDFFTYEEMKIIGNQLIKPKLKERGILLE